MNTFEIILSVCLLIATTILPMYFLYARELKLLRKKYKKLKKQFRKQYQKKFEKNIEKY